ncbi:MAG: hypothetical protein ACP5QD_05800, partial [Candidatus Ratteibacteria bacterium]
MNSPKTGYNRSDASWLLNNIGRKMVMYRNGEGVVFVGDNRRMKGRKRTVVYDKSSRMVKKDMGII